MFSKTLSGASWTRLCASLRRAPRVLRHPQLNLILRFNASLQNDETSRTGK